jgi:DNA-nicking Smr family endonuclease
MHEVPIEDSIDLHAFQPREIALVVEEYLYQAVAKGFREVRIIHGRGIGVQREIVRSLLEKHPNVRSFHDAPDRGSTTVFLELGRS